MRRQKYPHVDEGTRCGLFGKTRDARCAHQRRATARALPAGLVLVRVAGVCRELPRLGTRQLHFLLLPREPRGAGRDYPMALLVGHGRLIRRRKRRVVTARAWLPLLRRLSLIGRLTASGAEQVWFSDSTYVRLRSGWSYRRPIRDLYSHKIVGAWPHAQRSVRGVRALAARTQPQRLVHPSDRGLQYAARDGGLLESRGVALGMTQCGDPYENAVAERVNGTPQDACGRGDTARLCSGRRTGGPGRTGPRRAAPVRQRRLSDPEPDPRAGRVAGAAREKLLVVGGHPRSNRTHRPSSKNKSGAYFRFPVKFNPDHQPGL